MQNEYEAFLAQNRAFTVRTADGTITEDDLVDIQSAQLLLDLSHAPVLNALRDGLFSVQNIKALFRTLQIKFIELETVYRTPTGDIFNDTLAVDVWAFVAAEQLLSQLLYSNCIEALDEQRVTFEDLQNMSPDELSTAISENRYPRDSTARYQ